MGFCDKWSQLSAALVLVCFYYAVVLLRGCFGGNAELAQFASCRVRVQPRVFIGLMEDMKFREVFAFSGWVSGNLFAFHDQVIMFDNLSWRRGRWLEIASMVGLGMTHCCLFANSNRTSRSRVFLNVGGEVFLKARSLLISSKRTVGLPLLSGVGCWLGVGLAGGFGVGCGFVSAQLMSFKKFASPRKLLGSKMILVALSQRVFGERTFSASTALRKYQSKIISSFLRAARRKVLGSDQFPRTPGQ